MIAFNCNERQLGVRTCVTGCNQEYCKDSGDACGLHDSGYGTRGAAEHGSMGGRLLHEARAREVIYLFA
jgi:hypothetical protein